MRAANRLVLALLLLVVAIPASAAVHYTTPVSPYSWAQSTNSGTPCPLTTANANAAPGDTIQILPGDYSAQGHDIAPAASGTSGARIVYMGYTRDTVSAVVRNITLGGKSYVTVKWVRATGSAGPNSATASRSDSIMDCRILGSLEFGGSHDFVGRNLRVGRSGTHGNSLIAHGQDLGGVQTWRPRLENVTAYVGGWSGSIAGNNAFKLSKVFGSTWSDVYVEMYATGADGTVQSEFNWLIGGSFTRLNVRSINKTTGGDNPVVIFFRDSTQHNTFTDCSFVMDPASTKHGRMDLSGSGDPSYATPYSQYDNRFVGCYFNMDGLFRYQYYGRRYVFDHCIMNVPQLYLGEAADSLAVDHCTLYASGGREAIQLDKAGLAWSNLTFTNNIVYKVGGSPYALADMLTTGTGNVIGNNLYYSTTLADSTKSVRTNGGNSRVGPSVAWCSSSGFDCQSRFGNPGFTNPAAGDFTVSPTGNAVGAWWPDGYVGALAPAGVDPCLDADRPGKVTNIEVIAEPLSVGWIHVPQCPGETQFTGTGENCEIYVRRSTAPILTLADWNAATPVLTDLVANWVLPGEELSLSLPDYVPADGVYWFAMRFFNTTSGKWSCVSNTDSATFVVPDVTPPATISDLAATSSTRGIAVLSWTAPIDDKAPAEYDIRFRYDPLTSAVWDDTTRGGTGVQGRTFFARYPAADVPAPLAPGVVHNLTIALRQGTPIYFAMKTRDAAGNWSDISNTDSVVVVTGADEFNYPRTYVYGGAGTYTGIPQFRPLLQDDSLTINTTELNKLARHNIVTINPNAACGDSIVAVVRYLRSQNPRIRILAEPVPDVAYYNTPINTVGTGPKYRREFDYYRRVWNALNTITPWPSSFTLPYQNAYGVPQGYGASPDTTTQSAWLWSRIPGRKNALWETVEAACPCAATSGVYANAGSTLRNVNIAYRDANGRFLVADSLARIEKELFYDRTYTELDGSTRRLFDGLGRDLHSYFANLNPSGTGFVDSVDWVRAGYANRPDFNAGFTDGAIYFDRAASLLMPQWYYFGGNGYNAAGHDVLPGFLHEYLWTLQGASVESNMEWAPGGTIYDAWRGASYPQFNTMFAVPAGEFNDTTMTAGWTPDTSEARREYRWFSSAAAMTGHYFNFGTRRAFAGVGQVHASGAYYGWRFDEQFVNRGSGAALSDAVLDSSGWLGRPTTAPYQHYPGAAGAVFLSNFTNGSSPDSSIWQTLQKGSTGRVTVRPTGPNGLLYHIELRPAAIYGADWQLGAVSKGFNVTNQDYTISGWIKADTTRFVHIGLRDSSTAGPWTGAGGTGRAVLATPEWRPFAFKVFAGGSSAKVGVYVYAADTIGTVRIAGFQCHPGDSVLHIREFEHGVVLMNPGLTGTRGHKFDRFTRRLTARAGIWRNVNNGTLSREVSVPAKDGIFLLFAQDSLRPAPITDLSMNCPCSIGQVSWTATGDDSLTGMPERYEVRRSTSAISTENAWENATLVWNSAVGVQAAGITLRATVPGLARNTKYYVAVRAYDDAENPTPIVYDSFTTGNCRARRRWF